MMEWGEGTDSRENSSRAGYLLSARRLVSDTGFQPEVSGCPNPSHFPSQKNLS